MLDSVLKAGYVLSPGANSAVLRLAKRLILGQVEGKKRYVLTLHGQAVASAAAAYREGLGE